MLKRKLKGRNSRKIPQHKKEKMEKTLETMGKNREADNIILRDLLASKLKWAIAEKEKGIKVIDSHQQVIDRTKKIMLKLEGIIMAFDEILNPPKEEEKKEK